MLVTLTAEQIKQIPALKKEGLTSQQIANKFGCHRESVLRWIKRLKEAGYEVENKRGRPPIIL